MSQIVTKETGGNIYKIHGEWEIGKWLESSLDVDEYVILEKRKGNKNVEIEEQK